jgi:hypothetical protein
LNIRKLSAVLLAGAAGSTLVLSASAAGAAMTRLHSQSGGRDATKSAPVRLASPHIPFSLPKGYTVVTKTLTANPGSQSPGAVTCPGTEQPVGGGAFIASSDLQANIHGSFPFGQSWGIDINNPSSSSTNFTMYVVCMAYSPYYQVVASAPATASPVSVSSQYAVCPAGTSVVGGGAESSTAATDVSINSTVPNYFAGGHTGWRVAIASSDLYNTSFTVLAVCRPKPTGYSIQWGPNQSNGAYSETLALVTCPGASVPIGGGGFSGYQQQDGWIAMNSSYPQGNSWLIYENNGENVVRSVEAAAICAGS